MLSRFSIILIALAAGPVGAQPVLAPDAPASTAPATRLELAIDITAAPAELDPAEVRAAIATELDIHVTDVTRFAPALGRLTIVVDGGSVLVAYEPAAGSSVERAFALPAAQADRVQLIAFIAANLIRDQAGELLAALATSAQRPDVPPIAPPPARTTPHPTAAPRVELAATIGFIPPFAVDRLAGAHVVVGAGLHALIGMTDGSRLVSISGLFDAQREFASGIQIGGLAATAGRLDNGVQIGGLGAVSHGEVSGIQLGGLGALARGDVSGIQIGGLAAAGGRDVDGGQIGGIASLGRRHVHGAQIGGIATVAGDLRGFQIAGITTVAERVDGVQIAGIATVGGDVRGAQIGLVNVARRMHGVQLGLVNVSDDGDDAYPIGVLNFVRNGRVEVDAWTESSRLSAIALRHGSRHIHNIWALAWSPDHDHILAGAGLGFHTRLAGSIGLDVDALNWWTDAWDWKPGQLDQLRATIAIPVGPIEVIGGAAANVYISDNHMDESANFHPVLARTYVSSGDIHVVSWPSVFAGIRMRAR